MFIFIIIQKVVFISLLYASFIRCETANRNFSIVSAPVFAKHDGMRPYKVHYVMSSVEFRCEALGNPAPSVMWLKDGHILELSKKNHPNKWTLKLRRLKFSDAGNYTCIVYNVAGRTHYTYVLSVILIKMMPPKIWYIKPGNTTTYIGTDVVFTCDFISADIPFLGWFKVLEENSSKHNCKTCRNMKKLKSDEFRVLRLKKVTVEDSGEYMCAVSDLYGETERSVWLEVVPSPDVFIPFFQRFSKFSLFLIAGVFACTMIVVVISGCCYKRKKNVNSPPSRYLLSNHNTVLGKKLLSRASNPCVIKFRRISSDSGGSGPIFHDYCLPMDVNWEIPKNKIELRKVLGVGSFGQVLEAVACDLRNCKAPETVAVKIPKTINSERDVTLLISKMEAMKSVGKHANVIGLLACCTKDGSPWIVMEYAANGNLKKFLSAQKICSPCCKKSITMKDLLSFGCEIACGMQYLESLKIVHAHLAARNILVTEDWTMKISDFGLPKNPVIYNICDNINNHEGLLLKWMAPESFENSIFNSKSDVWSFGVVLWEIITRGAEPYPSVSTQELTTLIHDGRRLEKPKECSDILYIVMMECWKFEPERRVPFSVLASQLKSIVSQSSLL